MRVAAKTLSYGLMHFTVAVAVGYALTGDLRVALAIGLIEPLVQTVAYAIHERVFERYWPAPPRRRSPQEHAPAPLPPSAAPG